MVWCSSTPAPLFGGIIAFSWLRRQLLNSVELDYILAGFQFSKLPLYKAVILSWRFCVGESREVKSLPQMDDLKSYVHEIQHQPLETRIKVYGNISWDSYATSRNVQPQNHQLENFKYQPYSLGSYYLSTYKVSVRMELWAHWSVSKQCLI